MKSDNKPSHKKGWILLFIIVILTIGWNVTHGNQDNKENSTTPATSNSKSTSREEEKPESQPAVTDTAPQPELQKQFLSQFETSKTEYSSSKTDLQKSDVLTRRDNALCSIVASQFSAWSGKIRNITANREGKAAVSIELSPAVQLSTWNNAISDSSDKTLIEKDNALYTKLLSLEKGTNVLVSGSFIPSTTSCIKTSNVTETFRALDPDFIVKFSDVQTY